MECSKFEVQKYSWLINTIMFKIFIFFFKVSKTFLSGERDTSKRRNKNRSTTNYIYIVYSLFKNCFYLDNSGSFIFIFPVKQFLYFYFLIFFFGSFLLQVIDLGVSLYNTYRLLDYSSLSPLKKKQVCK